MKGWKRKVVIPHLLHALALQLVLVINLLMVESLLAFTTVCITLLEYFLCLRFHLTVSTPLDEVCGCKVGREGLSSPGVTLLCWCSALQDWKTTLLGAKMELQGWAWPIWSFGICWALYWWHGIVERHIVPCNPAGRGKPMWPGIWKWWHKVEKSSVQPHAK